MCYAKDLIRKRKGTPGPFSIHLLIGRLTRCPGDQPRGMVRVVHFTPHYATDRRCDSRLDRSLGRTRRSLWRPTPFDPGCHFRNTALGSLWLKLPPSPVHTRNVTALRYGYTSANNGAKTLHYIIPPFYKKLR